MTTLVNGLIGGLVAGLLAGVALQLLDNEPDATAVLLSRGLEDATAASRWPGFAAQVAYGGLAGLALIVVELYALDALAVPPTFGEAFGVAVGWSALLFVAWVVVWRVVPSLPSDRSYLVELLLYHLVFGLALGLWIRVTWLT